MKNIQLYIIIWLFGGCGFLGWELYATETKLHNTEVVASRIGRQYLKYLNEESLTNFEKIKMKGQVSCSPDYDYASLVIKKADNLERKIKLNSDLNANKEIPKGIINYYKFVIDSNNAKHYDSLNMGFEGIKTSSYYDSITRLEYIIILKNIQLQVLRAICFPTTYEDRFTSMYSIATIENPIVKNGEEAVCSVFLGQYDSHIDCPVIISNAKLNMKDGIARYSEIAKGQGEHLINGYILVIMPQGNTVKAPFHTSYYVIPK